MQNQWVVAPGFIPGWERGDKFPLYLVYVGVW